MAQNAKDYLKNEIIENPDFSLEKFEQFFRLKIREAGAGEFLEQGLDWGDFEKFGIFDLRRLGIVKFSPAEKILIAGGRVGRELSDRAGKKGQYEAAKQILNQNQFPAGIFVFHDQAGNFRFSLVLREARGACREYSDFRRFTYFAGKELTNKTFLAQIGAGKFSNLAEIKDAFSIVPVTDIFYDEFLKEYNRLVKAAMAANNIGEASARDFVLLFAIRTIFLGFIQKRGWLGGDEKFIQKFFAAYGKSGANDKFYKNWLALFFFEALNLPIGRKVAYGANDFPKDIEAALQMAPFLNGGLFKAKKGYDDNGWIIPDEQIAGFFDFLFAHSFTIEENSLDDLDLQLNPEFLGIIFERLVNKADGAVYTPRIEVDFMCRLALVNWLGKNLDLPVSKTNLYELFFREGAADEDQKDGSFSQKEAKEIIAKLENLSVCDPAAGSGAFLVGMMQVLDDVEQKLKEKFDLDGDNVFERKKRIIAQSLYGVEAKEWAVWIAQLRLWLSLFVDAPEEMKNSIEPILPSLDFKIRKGDSLVQRVGKTAFPVFGHGLIPESAKRKIAALKNLKIDYFNNKTAFKDWEIKQRENAIFQEILKIEIDAKKEEVRNLKNYRPGENLPLFKNWRAAKQAELEFNQEKIAAREKEIEDLRMQIEFVRHEKPLVWSIEFAEIFAQKSGFDIIIGNPPYVRQESIADPAGVVNDKKEYKKFLAEMSKLDFPADFGLNSKINAQSDLYVYFYIRGLRLLNPRGVHCFICSNSWLDVGYGARLQEFLLNHCPIEFIIDNHARRSFAAADVNTIISLIFAPQKKVDENHLVKFVAFKKPFEDAVFTENLLLAETACRIESNDVLRVYPISTGQLLAVGTEFAGAAQEKMKIGEYTGGKWGGNYLRAPDIFFTILRKGQGKLVKLGDIADVRFGIKTGVNEFFYLDAARIAQWQIEPEFLKPVIKSPRECKSILVDPENLKYKIFLCNKSKKELKGTNALKYIEWGEKQKNKDGVYWNNVASVSGRKFWWGLGKRNFSDLIFPCGIRDNYKVYKNIGILIDKRLYEIYCQNQQTLYSLNATLAILNIEMQSRNYGGGGGLIDVTVDEVERLLIVEPNIFTEINFDFKREIKSVFEECGIDPQSKIPIEEQEPKPLLDRAELDNIVFDALGLNEAERKDVYRAVCRLVWNRISKAKNF